MAYKKNPFAQRASEQTTSDKEFVNLFSPDILKVLPREVFEHKVVFFRSSPGGGKTTLMRSFSPGALHEFLRGKKSSNSDLTESFCKLKELGVFSDTDQIGLATIRLSCASGYADLPSGSNDLSFSMFRGLVDCRIVLNAVNSFLEIYRIKDNKDVKNVRFVFNGDNNQLRKIPSDSNAQSLLEWAKSYESDFYDKLDFEFSTEDSKFESNLQLEGPIWLSNVAVYHNDIKCAIKPILVFDDLHKLRKKQRTLIITELIEQRNNITIWLSERTTALESGILSQGVRDGREAKEFRLEDLWSTGGRSSTTFLKFAQNVLQRRMQNNVILGTSFQQYLENERELSNESEIIPAIESLFLTENNSLTSNRYDLVVERLDKIKSTITIDNLIEFIKLRILTERDKRRTQMEIDFEPISVEELQIKDTSALTSAAELFLRQTTKMPYYFGFEKLTLLASQNIEELLYISSRLYASISRKKSIFSAEEILSAKEQEKEIVKASKAKLNFIPKNHTHGSKAKRLLESIGSYCKEKTYLPTAPYAPGVTGIRLRRSEMIAMTEGAINRNDLRTLQMVLSECVAENLLLPRESAESTNRDAGTVFYLNRLLCASFDLPLGN